jgi:hypothetical protein
MTPEQIEAFVDASAAALALDLQPAHRPGVLRFVAIAADMAAVLDAVPLDRAVEPAVVFMPASPVSPARETDR